MDPTTFDTGRGHPEHRSPTPVAVAAGSVAPRRPGITRVTPVAWAGLGVVRCTSGPALAVGPEHVIALCAEEETPARVAVFTRRAGHRGRHT